jgi:hypothetical protein
MVQLILASFQNFLKRTLQSRTETVTFSSYGFQVHQPTELKKGAHVNMKNYVRTSSHSGAKKGPFEFITLVMSFNLWKYEGTRLCRFCCLERLRKPRLKH